TSTVIRTSSRSTSGISAARSTTASSTSCCRPSAASGTASSPMRRALRTVRARITLVAAGAFAVAFTLTAFALDRVVDNRVHSEPLAEISRQVRQPVFFQLYDTTGVRLDGESTQSFAVFRDGTIVGIRLPSSEYRISKRRVLFPDGTSEILLVAASLESDLR